MKKAMVKNDNNGSQAFGTGSVASLAEHMHMVLLRDEAKMTGSLMSSSATWSPCHSAQTSPITPLGILCCIKPYTDWDHFPWYIVWPDTMEMLKIMRF